MNPSLPAAGRWPIVPPRIRRTARRLPMFRRRTAFHATALWLTLAGVLLRGLIPVGFMPGWVAASETARSGWMVICPTSPLHAVRADATDGTPAGHLRAALQGLPADAVTGPICHGDGRPDATARVDPAVADDDHLTHRITAQHLDCPFAAAAAAVLPAAGLAVAPPVPDGAQVAVARNRGLGAAPQRRLPPARAPPDALDTTHA